MSNRDLDTAFEQKFEGVPTHSTEKVQEPQLTIVAERIRSHLQQKYIDATKSLEAVFSRTHPSLTRNTGFSVLYDHELFYSAVRGIEALQTPLFSALVYGELETAKFISAKIS